MRAFEHDIEDAAWAAFGDELAADGAQIHVIHEGRTADVCGGHGTPGSPLTAEHSFNVYCALKPALLLAAVGALERTDLAFGAEVQVADLLGRRVVGEAASVCLGHLLAHRGGLSEPSLFTFLAANDASRRRWVVEAGLGSGIRPETAYSEVSLLALLARVLAARQGPTLGQAFEECIRANDLDKSFIRRSADVQVACYVDGSGEPRLPMLHDTLEVFTDSPWTQYYGGYTNARDLCRWYDRLGEVCRGGAVAGFPSPRLLRELLDEFSDDAPPDARFGAGLMVDLPARGLSGATSASFGHFGFVRSSLGVVIPEARLSIAGVLCDLRLDELDERLAQWDQFLFDVLAAVRC